MPAAGPFGVKGVNGSPLESRNCIFDKTALVQCVSVDKDLHVHVIRDGKAAVDRGRSRPPVLMKLEAARSCFNLLDQTCGKARIAFAEKAEIHGKGIGSLEHPPNMPWSWSAGRGSRPGRWPCPTAHHRGEARIKRLLDLLRADEVDMHVDAAGSDNLAFGGDHLGSRSDNYVDVGLHIGIACFACGGNTPILDR